MNENISKILEQPVFERLREWSNIGPVQSAAVEEFAKQIIEACTHKCQTDWYGDSLDDICSHMKSHFGVDHGR